MGSLAALIGCMYAASVAYAYWGFGEAKETYLVDGVPTVYIVNPALPFWHRISSAMVEPFGFFGHVWCHRGWNDEPCPEPLWHRR